jgi:hypothetical protein
MIEMSITQPYVSTRRKLCPIVCVEFTETKFEETGIINSFSVDSKNAQILVVPDKS